MRLSYFKKRIKDRYSPPVEVLIDLDSLEKYHPDNNKLIVLVRDSRSYQKDGYWHIYPIALSRSQVYIVCPYCGEIHAHGNDKGGYEGFRVPHCHPREHDYCIDNLPEAKGGETL